MKYFIDTEFIEGFKKPFPSLPTLGNFNKPYHCIQLISIGIVCEDGREYSAISNEFNYDDASQWVKDNVIAKLKARNVDPNAYVGHAFGMDAVAIAGKSINQIAKEIIQFTRQSKVSFVEQEGGKLKVAFAELGYAVALEGNFVWHEPKFYADFSAYDWVLFCTLFGTMMDLPKGYPMYCRDLKQTFDELAMEYFSGVAGGSPDYEASVACLKRHPGYPVQDPETKHIAICDARHNRDIDKFLTALRAEIALDKDRAIHVSARRSGNTTRRADWYIQQLFKKGKITVADHHPKPERFGDKHLFRLICGRLGREHDINAFHLDAGHNTICFKESYSLQHAIRKILA